MIAPCEAGSRPVVPSVYLRRPESATQVLSWAFASLGMAFISDPAQAHGRDALEWRLASTTDGWVALSNPVRRDAVVFSKIDAELTVKGEAFGLDGVTGRVSSFHVLGHGPSERLVADAHGIDNAESDVRHRLLEAWVDARLSGNVSVRLGLMDLNAQFDAIEAAGLFLNSGHGMGSEFAASGVNGPSTYPATGLGINVRGEWSGLTVQGAVFDGAPRGFSDDGKFLAIRLHREEGALFLGQVEYDIEDTGVSFGFGAYHYSRAPSSDIEGPSRTGGGAYAMTTFALGSDTAAWFRIGHASASVSDIRHQISGGLTQSAPFGRDGDMIGIALSSIRLRPDGPGHTGYGRRETNLELTYRYAFNDRISLQPDVQYVIQPAYDRGGGNALVVGARLQIVLGNDI
ncbi:porin [Sphingosinicella microcystinivorans]|uniref:Porin n=2 Tax=Sphingosinicella microcystinivorans TaxID=335406 RepID=A0ABX9T0W9_SPHMI|nr:porin [Sphingosinicella microcystinivorans]